jgi:hypothetical protein
MDHSQSNVREFFLIAVVLVFLLLTGREIYRLLYPVRHWIVECAVKDSGGRIISTRTSGQMFEAKHVEDFVEWASRRGESCKVTAHRVWYTHYRPGHPPRRRII